MFIPEGGSELGEWAHASTDTMFGEKKKKKEKKKNSGEKGNGIYDRLLLL